MDNKEICFSLLSTSTLLLRDCPYSVLLLKVLHSRELFLDRRENIADLGDTRIINGDILILLFEEDSLNSKVRYKSQIQSEINDINHT